MCGPWSYPCGLGRARVSAEHRDDWRARDTIEAVAVLRHAQAKATTEQRILEHSKIATLTIVPGPTVRETLVLQFGKG